MKEVKETLEQEGIRRRTIRMRRRRERGSGKRKSRWLDKLILERK